MKVIIAAVLILLASVPEAAYVSAEDQDQLKLGAVALKAKPKSSISVSDR